MNRSGWKKLSLLLITGIVFLCYRSNAQYCTLAASNCGAFGNFSIDSVSFSTIHNASSCSSGGYADYSVSVPVANVVAGTFEPIYLKFGSGGLSKYVTLAIDVNHNNIFDLSEIQQLGPGTGPLAGMIRIPFTALTGATRMRIRVSDGFTGLCNAIVNGETEDYTLNITAPTTPGPYFALYVKANATGLNNGTSWLNAFTTYLGAINLAGAGDTIKIAKGTYTTAGYFSQKDSIIIWGGYPNAGNPTNAERNWGQNPTLINGSLFSIFPGNTSAYTQLNGVVLNTVVNVSNGSPLITNNVFNGIGVSFSNGSPTVSNCFFQNGAGGTGYIVNSTNNSSPVFANCIFYRNYVRTVVYAKQSSPKFFNCVFFSNSMGSGFVGDPVNSTGTIVAQTNSAITVANSIFFGNNYNYNLNIDSSDIVLSSSTANVLNTITQGYRYGNNQFLAVYPKFRDSSSIAGPDGFYFTGDDGFQLVNPCSFGINKGNNAAIAAFTKDMLGNPRIFQSIVDLGAYEVQSNLAAIPAVLYVNAAATGSNDGSSWANAYTNLQSAFQSCSDTIKVAKGTYYPSNSNKRHFFWLENHRIILGGYPNTGNPGNSARDPSLNPTMLTGNLPSGGGNNSSTILWGTNVDSTSILDGFIIRDANNTFTQEAALVFNKYGNGIIRNSVFKLNLSGLYNGGAILVRDTSNPRLFDCVVDSNGAVNNNTFSDHGAISCLSYSKPLFKRCVFKNNVTWQGSTAPYYGGTFYNDNSSPVIDSCSFNNNLSNNFGGAIANFNSSNPIISNSSFKQNYANNGGAHIYNDNSSPVVSNTVFFDTTYMGNGGVFNVNSSVPVFTKCQFTVIKNNGVICINDLSSPVFNKCVFAKSFGSGTSIVNINYSAPTLVNCIASSIGAVSNNGNYVSTFMSNNKSFPKIINSTIVNHLASQSVNVIANADSSHLTLTNSILWNNVNVNPNEILNTGGASGPSVITASNSITQVYGVNGVNGMLTGINPRFIDITNPAGPDGIWFTADDGLRLCSCSPAINAGNNAAIAGYNTDILENPRISNSIVDMGAYEYQSAAGTPPKTFFVNASATGLNDGSSWSNAYTGLQPAIQNLCADTIKIAMGIYKPAISARDSAFNINRGLVVYGSYPNTGNPTDAQRNKDLYPTVLSGDIGVLSDSLDNSRNVVWVHAMDTSVLIDGIIIERGNANGSGAVIPGFPNDRFGGGLLATQNRNLKIYNCTFRNNYGLEGSGLYSYSNLLEIGKCVFTSNNSYYGTLNIQSNSNKIKNSVFYNNTGGQGGAVHCKSAAIFENIVFYKNTAQTGAGVYLDNNPAAKFTNCDFVRNNSTSFGFGTGLYNVTPYIVPAANPVIRNCIFKDNTYGGFNTGVQYSDWVWINGINSGGAMAPMDVHYSASTTNVPADITNISPAGVVFKNIDTAVGTDNIWFTADDGLFPAVCSNTFNKGDNASVATIPFDIMDSARIQAVIVDVSAYEYRKGTVRIQATDTLVCPGTSITFTATPINANPNLTFTWMVNSVVVGGNSPTYTSGSLINNDTVKVRISSTDPACVGIADTAISNEIIIRVTSSLVPSVTISTPVNTICSGMLVMFTAVPVNGGSGLIYQWKKNGINVGTNSNQYSDNALLNNDVITVQMTSSLSCASPSTVTSNSIMMTVNASPLTSVTVAASATTICTGTNIIFTATPVNGGATPSYQWKLNGTNVGSNSISFSSSALGNNDVVNVVMTSSLSCASPSTSNSFVITVNPTGTPAVSIVASANNICTGTSVIFTATPVNGGSAPTYQWQVNGVNAGSNNAVFASASLSNNDQVKLIMTSSSSCVTQPTAVSNIITMSVGSPVTPTISIAASSTNICSGTSASFTATVTNGGTAPSYQWKVNNINAGTNSPVFTTGLLQNGDIIICNMLVDPTLACVSSSNAASNQVIMTVTTAPVLSVSIAASTNVICDGTPVSFTATVNDPTLNPVYSWKLNGSTVGSNSPLYTNSNLVNADIISCVVSASSGSCPITPAVSNVITMSVSSTPVISISPVNPLYLPGSQVQLSATAMGLNNTYSWSPPASLVNPFVLSPLTKPLDSTITFTLNVSNQAGCNASAFVIINISQEFVMPSGFTPNEDGKNDLYRIPPRVGMKLDYFSIYDRYGIRVFHTTDVTKGWDGKYRGVSYNTSVFIYIIKGTVNGKEVFEKGSFTLVR